VKPSVDILGPPEGATETFGPALERVEQYGQLLATVGVERGLIGPREVDRLWDRHLLNSAVLAPFLPEAGRVVDLGSGAGLPGIIVALMRPDLDVVLLEPLLRRATFLAETVDQLGLSNSSVVRARAEDWKTQEPATAAAVVARAVAPLERLAGWAVPLIAPGGVLLALKGETADAELAAAGPALIRLGISEQALHKVSAGTSVTGVVRLQRGRATVSTAKQSKRRTG